MKKTYLKHALWKMSDPFCVTVSSILFIAYIKFKQQELTQLASETGKFKFQVSKKPSFKMNGKLKGVSFCVN